MVAKQNHIFTVSNTKTLKGEKYGYLTIILHFSPHKANDTKENICSHATKECIALCLNKSGLADIIPMVQKVRRRKTNEFLQDKVSYTGKILEEIAYYQNRATKKGLKLAVRLNGTSDIEWSNILYQGKNIFEHFPMVQFYDYTKNPDIVLSSIGLKNYHVVFSWSGLNEKACLFHLKVGYNVAVPFAGIGKGEPLPESFLGYPVIDGDISDLRFLDKRKVVVGLRVKGNKQRKVKKNKFLVQISRKG